MNHFFHLRAERLRRLFPHVLLLLILVLVSHGFGDFFANSFLESTPAARKRDIERLFPHSEFFGNGSMRCGSRMREQWEHLGEEFFIAPLFVAFFEFLQRFSQ